jgi:hypothetical protein
VLQDLSNGIYFELLEMIYVSVGHQVTIQCFVHSLALCHCNGGFLTLIGWRAQAF